MKFPWCVASRTNSHSATWSTGSVRVLRLISTISASPPALAPGAARYPQFRLSDSLILVRLGKPFHPNESKTSTHLEADFRAALYRVWQPKSPRNIGSHWIGCQA